MRHGFVADCAAEMPIDMLILLANLVRLGLDGDQRISNPLVSTATTCEYNYLVWVTCGIGIPVTSPHSAPKTLGHWPLDQQRYGAKLDSILGDRIFRDWGSISPKCTPVHGP
jgi:hypothetical protein